MVETRNTVVGRIADRVGLSKAFGKRKPFKVDEDRRCVVSPVQARVVHLGKIEGSTLISKSGRKVGMENLLGKKARAFRDGFYLNLYLSPRNKHFWVTPYEGKFTYTQKSDGTSKFPVIVALENVTSKIPGVRRIPVFDKATKKNATISSVYKARKFEMAMIAVGSLNVNRIITYYEEGVPYERGALCGEFRIGSSMLLCFPDSCLPLVMKGQKVEMGERIVRAP